MSVGSYVFDLVVSIVNVVLPWTVTKLLSRAEKLKHRDDLNFKKQCDTKLYARWVHYNDAMDATEIALWFHWNIVRLSFYNLTYKYVCSAIENFDHTWIITFIIFWIYHDNCKNWKTKTKRIPTTKLSYIFIYYQLIDLVN